MLTDPDTFGEDLEFNLRTVSDLAERYCVSCQGYHVLYAAKRLMPNARIIEVDRKEMAASVQSVAEKQLASSGKDLEIIIAGAADTGLLATAAHGIALISKSALARIRFTVLDRCRTPLELCRYFGQRHNLRVETEVVDLITDGEARKADLILAHSLLRYIPRESHVDVLRKFGQWLGPAGCLIFSTRLESDAKGEVFEREQRDIGDDILKRIREGQLSIGESVETYAAKLRNRSFEEIAGYDDLTDLQAFFDLARMPMISKQIVQGEIHRLGKQTTRRRAIIVLGAPQP
jgi:hypothetical protein